jgi:hypothetical protein
MNEQERLDRIAVALRMAHALVEEGSVAHGYIAEALAYADGDMASFDGRCDMNEVEMLQQRIKNLEAMLTQATDLLDYMVSRGNIHEICDYLADAEELVGESRALLEEEFKE